MTGLEWRPALGPGATAVLVAALVCAMAALQRRAGARGWPRVLRTAALGAGVLALWNPVGFGGASGRPSRPVLTVLVDASRSMSEEDAAGGTRYQAAVRAVAGDPEWVARLARRFDVRYRRFAAGATAVDAGALAGGSPDGRRTDLSRALIGAGEGAGAGSRVILASDGRDTEDGDAEAAARALRDRGMVVDTLAVGAARPRVDAAVVAQRAQLYAGPGQVVQVGAVVRTVGVPRADTLLTLRMAGRFAASRRVRVDHGMAETSLSVTAPGPGVYRLVLAIVPPPGDCNPSNDRARVLLTVGPGRVRALYLDGQPSWDSTFFTREVGRDPGISLDVVYRLTPGRYYAILSRENRARGVELPRTVTQFARYDVVVLGKGADTLLEGAASAALRDWVIRRGGSVLFARGASGALCELSPVDWTAGGSRVCRLKLTGEGRSHPAFAAGDAVSAMPGVSVEACKAKPLAAVLAESEPGGMPVMAYEREGDGVVMAVSAEGLWRWAFADPHVTAPGTAYRELWCQAIRWLAAGAGFAPGADTAIRADRAACEAGDEVRFTVLARHGVPLPTSVVVRRDGGSSEAVPASPAPGALRQAVATWRTRRPGEYTASVPGKPERSGVCGVSVSSGRREDLDRSADPDLMRRIAYAGGGRPLAAADLPGLPDRMAAQAEREERRRPPIQRWDTWPVLLAISGMLCVEWWIRRRGGQP